jgi:nitronate monooxygenase
VAAGGFADGRGLVAALALGADAVLMGTRFMATKECQGHPAWKEWMVNAVETDTACILKSINNPSRVAKNAVAAKVMEMEARGATLEELLPIISGGLGGALFDDGKLDSQLARVGQVVGLIHDVPTVKEFIDRTIEEAVQARERLNAVITGA